MSGIFFWSREEKIRKALLIVVAAVAAALMLRGLRRFRGRSFLLGRVFPVAAAGGGGLRLRVATAGAAPVGVAQGAQGGIEQQEGQKG